jgi:hypothetical protein
MIVRKKLITVNRKVVEISSHESQSCRSELEWGRGGSKEQSFVAVYDGCPMLQIGVTGNTD